MPTYEYACRNCGEHLEVVQSFSDDPLTECPHCQGELRKVFSPIGIAFKGSGFYRTDSKGSSSVPAASDSGSKESGSKDSGSGGSSSEGSSSGSSGSSGSGDKGSSSGSGDKTAAAS